MDTLDAIHEVSRRQHGLVLVEDLTALSITRSARRHLVRSGRLERLTRRVLRVPGAPRTDDQIVMAAVLDAGPGAAVCGPAGAALWGARGYRVTPVDVARSDAAGGRRSTLARHHQVADLRRRHVTELRSIPVVRPEIVVLQLCGSASPPRAAAVLDLFWRERLTSGPALRRTLAELGGSGRNGVVLLRELLDERGDDYVPPQSGLEGRFETILRQAGEPPMRRQVDAGGDHWVGRVDFRDTGLPLVVEVQSEKYHSALVDRRADERRLAGLRAAGFAVVEVTDWQVWHRPDQVIVAVREARRATARRVAAA
jgi:very-short-patch-repair endonuclease